MFLAMDLNLIILIPAAAIWNCFKQRAQCKSIRRQLAVLLT